MAPQEPRRRRGCSRRSSANEKVRKELAAIKKEARERAKKVAIRIPKLTDCKVHFDDKTARGKRREETTIFLTEGDSAGGAMVQTRDVYDPGDLQRSRASRSTATGSSATRSTRTKSSTTSCAPSGIEDGIDGLRYNRVVIATDADVDGMHIRNLLLTYFLRYFEELVLKGHLYILETPLFRVRNKKETRYCYSDAERDAGARADHGPEVTRFKGLGEISPKEFGASSATDATGQAGQRREHGRGRKSLDFFMGKNTPERKSFIVDNLADRRRPSDDIRALPEISDEDPGPRGGARREP